MTGEAQEMFDLVDAGDRVIGRMPRAEVHRRNRMHRAVHVLVFDASGCLYLQRRSAHKDLFPGFWTSSCSGHVDSGESYDHAAVREMREELSIRLHGPRDMEFLFKQDACEQTGMEFVRVYHLIWPGPVVGNAHEISEIRRLGPTQVDDWLRAQPRVFTPCFRLIWKAYSDFLETRGALADPCPEVLADDG